MDGLCKFTKIKKKKLISPIIVEFQNGEIIENQSSSLKINIIPNELLTDKVIEVKSSDGQAFQNYELCTTTGANKYIAVRNRKTDKIKLIEVEFASLINSSFLGKVEEKSTVALDYLKDSSNLRKMFGTKKAVRRLEHIEDVKLDKSLMENQINEVVQDVTIPAKPLDDEEHLSPSVTPPCNRNADKLNDVYLVEHFLSDEELDSLSEAVQEMLNSGLDKFPKLSKFVQSCFQEAVKEKEKVNVRIACLIYAECLINFINTPTKNLKKTSQFCPYSSLVNSKIISEFCIKSGSSLQRSLMLKDKTLCYIIVLSLIGSNFSINLELLSQGTAVGIKKMMQLARAVGATPKARSSKNYILNLPLPPPLKVVQGNRSRKRF